MKTFLIVGGSSDIAQIVIKDLLGRGNRVVALVRNQENFHLTEGENLIVKIGDALEKLDVEEAVGLALEQENFAGAIHTVGSIFLKPGHATSVEQFSEVINTNLTSAFITLSVAGKKMLRNGGRMVFVSSLAASFGLPNHEAISAAKGGLESMVRSSAATYAKRKIQVNVVAPALTETKLASKLLASEAARKASEEMNPMGKIVQAEEVAKTISWLMLDAPDMITGETIHVDGGFNTLR